MKKIIIISIAVHLFAWGAIAQADNLPGDLSPHPTGTKVLGLRYVHNWGDDLYVNDQKVADDMNANVDYALLRTIYYGGDELRWGVSAGIPIVRMEVDSTSLGMSDSVTGVGDPHVIAGFWPLLGEKYHLGVAGWLFIPWGDYDNTRLLNPGQNIWSYRIEANLAYKPTPDWILETTTAAHQFSDNDEYGPTNATRERATQNTLEVHVSRNLPHYTRLSLSYYYNTGGETTINGIAQDDARDDHAVQISGKMAIARNQAISLFYRKDLSVANDIEGQTIGIRFGHAF